MLKTNNNIDLELYKVFFTVANLKNITKAAKELYISQPAVTMNIHKLEEALNVTLFVRNKHGVVLTHEGLVLYEYVKKALDNIQIGENRIENLKNLDEGNIRIGIGTTLTKHFLLPYIEKFHNKYPKINISIDTSMTFDIIQQLEDGAIDIAIITSDKKEFKNADIVYSEEIEDIFIANKKIKDEIKSPLNLSDLNNYPLLLQSVNSNIRQFLNNSLKPYNITLKSSMELASYSLVIEFAKIGFGIGFITKNFVKDELEKKELYEIKTTPKIPKRAILILTKKNYLPSFSTQKLLEIISNNNNNNNK